MRETVLEVATSSDAQLLSNLLELYVHDLSEAFALDVGADGRFGYDKLPLYWTEPARRFAFLIRDGGRIAGFTLVTRGSPASDDPDVLDVAEFFVLRRYRRAGVGRRAAFLLWNRIPGSWTVRVSEGNAHGLAFWKSVVSTYANGVVSESTRAGSPHGWRVFAFEARVP